MKIFSILILLFFLIINSLYLLQPQSAFAASCTIHPNEINPGDPITVTINNPTIGIHTISLINLEDSSTQILQTINITDAIPNYQTLTTLLGATGNQVRIQIEESGGNTITCSGIISIVDESIPIDNPGAEFPGCYATDVNRDGNVDALDINTIQNFLDGNLPENVDMDVNNDDSVDTIDLGIVSDCVAGNEPNYAGPGTVNVQPIPLPQGPPRLDPEFTGNTFITVLISKLLPVIFGIAGFISVILIIVSGIQFILASGNPEAAAAARGRLTMTIIGFAIILLAFSITQIIDRIFIGGTGVF